MQINYKWTQELNTVPYSKTDGENRKMNFGTIPRSFSTPL